MSMVSRSREAGSFAELHTGSTLRPLGPGLICQTGYAALGDRVSCGGSKGPKRPATLGDPGFPLVSDYSTRKSYVVRD